MNLFSSILIISGKISSYTFFVQTCREEHKKQHPDAAVNFSEFSKCSERWKTTSAKTKQKHEDMVKADKAHYEREMKTFFPPIGETKKFKDPNASKRSHQLSCSKYHLKIKGEHPGLSIHDVAKKLEEVWHNIVADDKQPYEKRAAKLRGKYEKDISAYQAKGKPDRAKKGVFQVEKSKRRGWGCGSSSSALAWHACSPGSILSTTYKQRCCVRRKLKNK
ncbi:LOW QUALITY PROTEIN: putative high mobility group protein B1-like 1 [Marmota marmota marmota]|uniref:LOW QUALITY PROTEIN: putative high mobility group protein B1-like 1 n=1 Tax=Marmota marmota marmota TaxID=9994 RepID=UPI002092AF03|nr:LOW QUALITY PROTEIN: putative high mobility group protein B1-like 1 [Marmota marmota marmota]